MRRGKMKTLFLTITGLCVLAAIVEAATTTAAGNTNAPPANGLNVTSTDAASTTQDNQISASTTDTGNNIQSSATTTGEGNEAALNESSANGCSAHWTECDENARCLDTNPEKNEWECKCIEGAGDGLKRNDTNNHTGCELKGEDNCRVSADCHPLAKCNNESLCICNDGYHGDGWTVCDDVNECLHHPCHRHAYCNNTLGSYNCTCNEKKGYHGNGSFCEFKCVYDEDCAINEQCNGDTCVCKMGYKKNETAEDEEGCIDDNECETEPCDGNATCRNFDGGYECKCNNGYRGNGKVCEKRPRTCDEIYQANNQSKSGSYEIDADFDGPMEAFEVDCEMRPGFGITIFPPKITKEVRIKSNNPNYNISYVNTLKQIKAVINISISCTQYMRHECRWGATLLDGDDYIVDGNGNIFTSFGGATGNNMCPCGNVTYCRNRDSNCNCDGSSQYGFDEGTELNKTRLPIQQLVLHVGKGRADITMGPVTCAPKHFDFPKDCHDAKTNRLFDVKTDGPLYIQPQPDGENGNLDPFLVHCDMESEKHVGITVLPSSQPTPVNVTQNGSNIISYGPTEEQLRALVDQSEFCQQAAGYNCRNSALMNNGKPRMASFSDTRGNEKDYFPGGLGQQYKCGCGVLNKCSNETFGCNCDSKDGKLHKDFGMVYDKNDLPIGDLKFWDIGGEGQFGQFYVGDLKCSQRQFGIPPLCNDLVYDEENFLNHPFGFESHPFVIDPDGAPKTETDTENQDPFLVYCDITFEPPYAATIVYHNQETISVTGNGLWTFIYKQAEVGQLLALIARSRSCLQTVMYTCNGAPLHADGENLVAWTTGDGRTKSYFDGQGDSPYCRCGLSKPRNCADPNLFCNCDSADITQRNDSGILLNEKDLPMMDVSFNNIGNSSSFAELIVGPLECRDLFPNCATLKGYRNNNQNKLVNEDRFPDGFYAIDPDGDEDVEPFIVECQGSRTLVPVYLDPSTNLTNNNTDEPVSRCYEVNYRTKFNDVTYYITPEQIQSLKNHSSYCSQRLELSCLNARLTGFSNYSTCDGVTQKGWAGSQGRDKCPCGTLGTCKGGSEYACNCDKEDGNESGDLSWIHDKDYLAICGVCIGLAPLSSLNSSVTPRMRRVQPSVSDLICDAGRIGKTSSCHDWRNSGMTESGVQMTDPDGNGPIKPTPIFCGIEQHPPLGYEMLFPKEPNDTLEIPKVGLDGNVTYWNYTMEFVRVLIKNSGYCTQEVILECSNASIAMTDGWFSFDGVFQPFLPEDENSTSVCAGANGTCNCNLPGDQIDRGIINNKTLLPVLGYSFASSTGYRSFKVGPLKCFNLERHCDDIKLKNLKVNTRKDNTYAIDPDQEGHVPYFAVTCDFDTDKKIGITVIKAKVPEGVQPVTGSEQPGETKIPVIYEYATPEQVNALANVSGFCHQGIQYNCKKSPLRNFDDPGYSYYTRYGGEISPGFGTAGYEEADVCACNLTDSCPGDFGCHCDAQGPMTVEYGHETNLQYFPIENFYIGGQNDSDAWATILITDARCGPIPFDLPEDCHEAFLNGMQTGEALIWPSPNVNPFLVYCDMSDGFGKTILSNDFEDGVNVTYDQPMPVTYAGASLKQIEALMAVSGFCYQSFKYECMYTLFLEDPGFFNIRSVSDAESSYVGYSPSYKVGCNCGRDGSGGMCGGSEDKDELINSHRRCNCDANDGKPRVDAGIYNSTHAIAIEELFFGNTGNPLSTGKVTLGKMYCADTDFDLDECKMNFHDCDKNARCINKHGYFQCRCNKGYQGLGRPNRWANGRDCPDDDECALNFCPDVSDCTNTEGSFYCVCRKGYNQTGPTTCKDIDECKLGTHNCDQNARCENTDGSFFCRCNRNYRGNGTFCYPMGECSCFGDPHCFTNDGVVIDYQGTCQYVMARDNCDNLNSTPSYELLIKNDVRPNIQVKRPVSWVRYALFRIHGYEISLLQGKEVWVNGERVRLPFREAEDLFHIAIFGEYVEIYTTVVKVEVTWDGNSFIEIRTPGSFKGQTCGFCGNYNDIEEDDLILGPACPGTGNVTDNFSVFGNSWLSEEYALRNPECVANCTPKEEPECDNIRQASAACKVVWDKNGRFRNCLNYMSNTSKERLLQACIYDVCAVDGDFSEMVCESAQMLYQECLNIGVNITAFRSEEFCGITCEENMHYLPAGPVNQKSCLDYLSNTTVTDAEPTFSEGCFCLEGYYRDGDSCVEEEDCGCYYNGLYYQLGDEITKDGCQSRGVCSENHTVVFDNITCNANAECILKNGRYGCHCKYGYFGDGVTCFEDKCAPGPCGENETCVRKPESEEGYECLCKMGFMGNCSNCTEMNECTMASYGCPYNADCFNTVGSYYCKCLDGYYMLGDQCHDINECDDENVESPCGNNTRCSNKPGTYECPCCNGFEEDENGTCVEKEGAVGGVYCCVCDVEICKRPGQVCGMDGTQYDNIAEMIITNCEKGLPAYKWKEVDYFGMCQDGCSPGTCPDYQECVKSPQEGKPKCKCEECSKEEKQSEVEVCTKNLAIYKNYCEFKQVQCHLDSQEELYPDMGPCHDQEGAKLLEPWSPWSQCSVSCGKGQQTKTRSPYKPPLTPEQSAKFPLELSKECYAGPCPNSSCVDYNCTKKAAECVVNGLGDPVCECPDCENVDVEPVCGFLTNIKGGPRPITWRSKCDFLSFVCNNGVDDFEFMHDGHCGSIPEVCTRVPNLKYLRGGPGNSTSYVSKKKVNLNKCVGGCEEKKEFCCQPVTKPITVELVKGTSTYFDDDSFEFIEDCECVPKQKEEEEEPVVA